MACLRWVGKGWRTAFAHIAGVAVFLFLYLATGPDTVRSPRLLISDTGDTLIAMSIMSWVSAGLSTANCRIADFPIFHPIQGALFFTEPMLGPAVIYGPLANCWGDQNFAFNLTVILLDALNYYSLFLFLRFLRIGHIASFCGAASFGLTPFLLRYMAHIQLHPLFPFSLTFMALTRFFEGRNGRWLYVIASLIALQLYFSTTLGIMLAFFVGLACLTACFSKDFALTSRLKQSPLHYLTNACLAFAVLIVLVLPLICGYYDVIKRFSFTRAWSDNIPFSLDSLAIVALLLRKAFVYLGVNWSIPIQNESEVYLAGLTPFIAVLLLILTRRHFTTTLTASNRSRNLFWCKTAVILSILAGGLTLGPSLVFATHDTHFPLPYRLFCYIFPGFNAMRAPVRFLVPCLFFASIVFAYLLHYAHVGATNNASLKSRLLLVAAAILAIGAFAHDRNISYPKGLLFSKELLPVPKVYEHVQNSPGLPVLEIPVWPPSFPTFSYFYYQSLDKNPRLGGISSFFPPSFFALRDNLSPKKHEKHLRFIASTEAKILIVHLCHLPHAEQTQWLALANDFDKFRFVGNIDGALLWTRE